MTPTQALTTGWAAASTQPVTRAPATADGNRQGFFVGGIGLMVRYEDASELAGMPEVFRLPNTPEWFSGIANREGKLVPVFDLVRYFGASPQAGARRMLLVLSHGADAAGLVIDGLPRRLRLSPKDRLEHSVVPGPLGACAGDVYRIDGHDWIDFRQAALLERLEEELAA
jgi:twitching motility protein PilI